VRFVSEGELGAVEAQRDNQWVRAAMTVRERGEATEQAPKAANYSLRVAWIRGHTQATRAVRRCQGLSPLQTSMLLDRLCVDCLPSLPTRGLSHSFPPHIFIIIRRQIKPPSASHSQIPRSLLPSCTVAHCHYHHHSALSCNTTPTMPTATAAYRPPPPAPSAYYAMQLNPNGSSQQVASPSTFLCRVPSKRSMQQFPDPVAQPSPYSSNVSTRSSSAASIAALPSLSNSLNHLANITSMEQMSFAGTRTAAEGEEMVSISSPFRPIHTVTCPALPFVVSRN